jgi:TonB family protein
VTDTPSWEVAASVGLHAVTFAALAVGERFTRQPPPLINPDEVMIVRAVALPKQSTRLPDRPTRAPDPVQGASLDAPAPPPPPTASDMALHEPDAPKEQGVPDRVDRSTEREALLREAKRKALVDRSAPLGAEDRTRTDPDGVDISEAVLGPGGAGPMDPEWARYEDACIARIMPNWTPLPATVASHPEYKVVLDVRIATDGTISEPRVLQGTVDASFDRTALMALHKTGRLPAPPDRFREDVARGVTIVLDAKEKAG